MSPAGVCRRPRLTTGNLRAHLLIASGAACLALALIGPSSSLAANPAGTAPGAPVVQIKRIVASSSPDKLIAKGVQVLVDTDTDCRLDASVYLGESVPGIGKRNAQIAHGSLIAMAGTSSLTAGLTRHAVRALRKKAGKVSLILKVRITATGI
jgi:hypothetical protein